MIRRCADPRVACYPRYGGRGITVCKRWFRSFEAFQADMGLRPVGGSLERIDNSRGYEADNCRWATRIEQQNNRRDNRRITFAGETRTLTEWGRVLGIPPHTLQTRLSRGWTVERAFSRAVTRKRLSGEKMRGFEKGAAAEAGDHGPADSRTEGGSTVRMIDQQQTPIQVQDLIILPQQGPTEEYDSPELGLVHSVLETILEDYGRDGADGIEARELVASQSEEPWSFRWCAMLLRLDPDWLAKKLADHQKAQQEQQDTAA